MSLSTDLGEQKEIKSSQGTLRYRECGNGPTLVFIHGLIVNGDLWRKVVPQLKDRFRCVTPDLPLGAHAVAMNQDADLTVGGMARLVAEFIELLELDRPTLVANDTGGAITQVLMTEQPGSVGRVIFTSCDCFDNFLPAMFRPLQLLANVPALLTLVLQPLRLPAARKLPFAYGWLAKRAIDPAIEGGYAANLFGNRDVRRDVYKLMSDISPRYTNGAAEKLGSFHSPVLVVWSTEDRFFPTEDGRKIASLVPDGKYVEVDDCYTFISEDQPDALAKHIGDFLA